MKSAFICAAVAACLAMPVHASEGEPKSSQQGRFAACAHESKGLRGDEHQKFMSDCLKGNPSAEGNKKEAAQRTASEGGQQNRMKSCNEQARAKDLHGDERRAFMSSCLKG